MGADVVKVERAAGDAMRTCPPVDEGNSENFASINRGKRSVVLDSKSPDGVENARNLILCADVVIENFRRGVMERNGLVYKRMSAEKPAIIYRSISAFGQSGPRSREGGFDLTMQAMAGVMSVTGEPGGAPVKCGVPLCDFVSGRYGAMGVVGALFQRNTTGEGQHVDVSILGATLGVAALQTSEYFGTGNAPKNLGAAHRRHAPYKAFKAQDDYFGMAAGNNSLRHHVCDVVGRADLKDVEKYSAPPLRAANQVGLKDLLEDIFVTQPVSHWLAAFADKGVPCSPINSFVDAQKDKQVAHMGWVQPITLPNGIETKTFGPVLRINDECQTIPSGPPALGEHTEAVLASLADDAAKA